MYANALVDGDKMESFSEFISKELQWTNAEKQYKYDMLALLGKKTR
jgi:hypothetical protein